MKSWSQLVGQYMGDDMREKFDTWLEEYEDELCADAWDEGCSAGQINEHEFREDRILTNPYREG